MRRASRVLRALALGLLALLIVAVAGGAWFVRRAWPEEQGTLQMSGLQAPVRVVRDTWGVPHIYAENEHDLFMAQGYVHAQDRLWQMELNRHVANGTLSAMVGRSTLDSDRFMRTVGMRRAAEKEWAALDQESRTILTAYVAGINAYIDSHRSRLPVQYTILRVTPERWTEIDSLSWGKLLSFSLGGNYRLELLRASLVAAVGPEMTTKLLPPYGDDKPIIVPEGVQSYAGLRGARFDGLEAVDEVVGDPGPVWGSNNWVIHGSRTATGKPLLANDTHLGLGMPSPWYENSLHGGRFQSVGFTFAGVPGVLIGHNQRIAWGVSNMNPDVEDFYIEKLDSKDNPQRYEFDGSWHDLQIIQESIPVKGAEPVALTVRLTRHGPIMNQVMGDLADAEPMALRWTVLDGTTLLPAVLRLSLAQSWDEFRQALSTWDAPAQNFVYADVDGNIGYQATGKIPIRPASAQGLMPVPGWTGDNEWQDYIPFERLPSTLNPAAGFIATANNKIVGDDYPYHLTYEWDPGFRAKRITDMLAENNRVTVDDVARQHADTYSLPAEALGSYLLAVSPQDDLQRRALDQVRAWDRRYEIDRAGASVYQVWYWFLLKRTLNDELGQALGDRYLAGQYERHGTFQLPLMIDLMQQPQHPWFDDKATPEVETRDTIAQAALGDAVAWLRERYGDDPAQWTWGRLHTMTFVEAPLGQAKLPLIPRIFNSRPIPARGDNFTVDAASFRYFNPFVMVHGSSQRAIMDLSDFANSRSIHATGQSGNLFHPHRDDFIELWQSVQYHPMLFTSDAIEANTEAVLTLTP